MTTAAVHQCTRDTIERKFYGYVLLALASQRLIAFQPAACCTASAKHQCNTTEIVSLLFKSHRAGISKATALLGLCFEFGIGGVHKNYKLAERYFTMAAIQGCGLAQCRLSFLKMYGRHSSIVIDMTAASHWRRISGRNGANQSSTPTGWFETASRQGMAVAQLCLAMWHYSQPGQHRHDAQQVVLLTRLAARDGNLAIAYNILGNLYLEGVGCEVDPVLAMQCYVKAAEMLEPAALYNIGMLFERGRGVPQDFGEAFRWYEKAAEHGSINAFNVLGVFHEQGIGTHRDKLRAVSYYTTASLNGHPHAQHNLARCYHDGFGVPRNLFLALAWFERSAHQHHTHSQLCSAISYEYAIGTPTSNMDLAKTYYAMAAIGGSPEARTRLVPIVMQDMLHAATAVMVPSRTQQAVGIFVLPFEIRSRIVELLDHACVLSRHQVRHVFQAAIENRGQSARGGTGQSLEKVISLFSKRLCDAVRSKCICVTTGSISCSNVKHIVAALECLDLID